MSKNEGFLRVLAKKPDVKPKRTITLAEKIVDEYTEKNTKDFYVAIDFLGKVTEEYKNTSALARMLGKMVKKKNLKGVKVVKDDKAVYLIRD